MRIQRSADHRIVPWANGRGITADVFLSPPDRAEWTWRLSIADITDDVPFSLMPGIDRHIMVASGHGMVLVVGDEPEIRMDTTTGPAQFDGDATTSCRLLGGPIKALNLMVRRGVAADALRSLRLPAGTTISIQRDDVAVVVLEGIVRANALELTVFDAAVLEEADVPIVDAVSPAWCAIASVRQDPAIL